MNENTNPEVNAEEAAAPASEEIAEEVENTAAADEDIVAEDAESTDEASTDTETESGAPAEISTDIEAEAKTDVIASEETDSEITAEQPAKKKRFLQIPVIISVCIVAAALIGYFVFTAFFLKEPEGVTWSTELDGTPYYFEFQNDGTLHVYVGTVEISGTYQKAKSSDGNTITTGSSIGYFYGNAPATYTISGSRILGNQTLDCFYSEDYQFTLNQSSRQEAKLDLPEDFTPDEDLLGSWVFQYFGYDIFRVTFNKDGSMSLEQVQEGVTYNGIYTLTDSAVNFTYYLSDNVVTPIDYSVDGDTLSFMGYNFVREGSELAAATADQVLTVPQD